MPLLDDWELELNADQVLWGQGADPVRLRERRPGLVEVAERALEEARPLLHPIVLYRRIPVKKLAHERLLLADGGYLAGPLIASQLAPAEEVIVAVCTVGKAIEARANQSFLTDPVASLALYGVGSAAAEALAEAACRRFDALAAAEGRQTSVPLNPGMVGWPLQEGQEQVFALLDTEPVGVRLTANGIMDPLKSLSLVMGVGRDLSRQGRTCDFCSMRETCRYSSGRADGPQ